MTAPGGEEVTQSCSGELELWWPFLYGYAKGLIPFRGLVCPVLCEMLPVHPLGCSLGSRY
ncbi:uncharacterized protein ACHE_20696S [Aspergillus chevalieri]|uniref:Uncharacterized protein n=1 Tax=Aspergillus chevalieri TaxID=182096 RepID=A0A7R7VJW1_ASPCH|nr:uncharacterized protein ACHE_20696S [Aspergillus chevalieri]BCR85238.1 hypothetical protein ACHE_20696S [Aspergillus chevalieri]